MTTFRLDWEYDRDNADTGTKSRYGNYLYQRAGSFKEIWYDDPTVEFAAIAWRIATGPIMAPPLVRSHPRVSSVTVERSNWNGEAVADICLVAPRPQQLDTIRPVGGGWWHDVQLTAWDRYDGIGEDDLTRNPYMLTETRLLWQLPPGTLPTVTQAPASSDGLFQQAVECLVQLVAVLNQQADPVIRAMDGK